MIYENIKGIYRPVNTVISGGGGVNHQVNKKFENLNGIYKNVFEDKKYVVRNGLLISNIFVLGNKTVDKVIFDTPFYTEQQNGYVSLKCGTFSTTRHGRILYGLDFSKMHIDITKYNKIYISAIYATYNTYSSEGTATNTTTVFCGMPYNYYGSWQQRSGTLNYSKELICDSSADGEGCYILQGDLNTRYYSGNYTFRINSFELRIKDLYLFKE